MLRVECPNCQTSYTLERCGLQLPRPDQTLHAIVVCAVCQEQTQYFVKPTAELEIVTKAPWYAPWREPETRDVLSYEISIVGRG